LPVNDDHLKTEFLFEEDFLLAVPAGHGLAANRHSLTLADLDRYDLMLLEEGHCLRDQALDVCRIVGRERAHIVSRHQPGDASADGWRRGRDYAAAGTCGGSACLKQCRLLRFEGIYAKPADRYLLAQGIGDGIVSAKAFRNCCVMLQVNCSPMPPAPWTSDLGPTRSYFHSHRMLEKGPGLDQQGRSCKLRFIRIGIGIAVEADKQHFHRRGARLPLPAVGELDGAGRVFPIGRQRLGKLLLAKSLGAS
jgi:hypothetical protein